MIDQPGAPLSVIDQPAAPSSVSFDDCCNAPVVLVAHAGHGLTFDNVGPVAALPEVVALNIGHFLIGQAIIDGLPAVVSRMKQLMLQARAGRR